MKQSRKDFIKKAHENACSEWKTNIEKEFPKLFKEDSLVFGKWYKRQRDNGLWFVTRFENGCSYGYGFDADGNWADVSKEYNYSLELTLATDKEVEQALIKEAKKRGFKKGCEYIGIRDLTRQKATTNIDVWSCNSCIDMGFDYVFLDGKWATIIETITKQQAETELGKVIIN
tara:strand:- start:492 stop:1010 length:519 start_codon:yes stop_codon:yes gene_type:complete